MKIKIGDITKIRTGKLDANAADENGQYPFFTCSKEPLKINTYSYDCECVLVAGNGDLNVKYYNGKFDAYQRTYIIEDDSDGLLFMPYLYFFMESYIDELRKQSIGGVIKYIKLKNLTDALIELPSIEVQKNIVNIISKSKEIVRKNKTELELLDEAIKARFVEMFGDPMINPYGWKVINISEVLRAKASNGFFSRRDDYCDDGNVWVLGVANVVNRMYSQINDLPRTNANEKDIEKFEVKYGDMLFCRSSLVAEGIGKASIIPEGAPANILFECHVIRLPLDLDKCVPEFLQTLSTTKFFRNQVISKAKTATMTTIGQDGILKTDIILPPLEKQREYYDFIKQIDKSRSRIQKSLEASQELFDSLMQEYFG